MEIRPTVDAAAPAAPPPAATRRYPAVAIVILSAVALALRLRAATDNFWLDEIFNYFLAKYRVHSLSDVFTGIGVEHQIMVTLSIYLTGDQMNWVWYRLPSVVTGTATIAMMALVGHRRMSTAALSMTMAVAAVSYPLVVYSSEARGYAPAAFFSLAMFFCLESYWRSGRRWYLPGFWLATVVAVLYHPAAICISLALGIWSAVRAWRRGDGFPRMARESARCHAVPLAFIVWLYAAVMTRWDSVGGDVLPIARVLGDTMAAAIGLPLEPGFRWCALGLGSVLLAAGLLILARRVRSDIWIFYVVALVVAPLLMLGISSRSYVYVRYFVVLFPFFYLLLGEAMDAAARESRWARLAVISLFILTLAGNCRATFDFLRNGRGGYLKAVMYMAANTPRPEITAGGDHLFRNEYTVDFYRRYLPNDRSLVYLKREEWPPEGPDWFLIQNPCTDDQFIPQPAITIGNSNYWLVESYPVRGLSGFGWHLYRNGSRVPATGASGSATPTRSPGS